MEGWTIPSGALFHLKHLGPEFRVLVPRLSVPNCVWDAMGSPFLTYLASNISSGGPSCFYHLKPVCVTGRPPADFKQPGPMGTWLLEKI